jgi:23S rRNA (uridine2552-2'-O)-methyltransferase
MPVKQQLNRSLKQSSRVWIKRHINDPYVALAKEQEYRSRSAFKLLEMQEKFKIIKKEHVVLDLGAAPGGWSQIAAKISQNVIAVDIIEMQVLPNVRMIKGDFLEQSTLTQIVDTVGDTGIDVILSDMCPNTCGIRKVDHLRIINMLEEVIIFTENNLRVGGSIIAKSFQGGSEKELLIDLKRNFEKVKHFKPKASRNSSPELYLIATGFLGANR